MTNSVYRAILILELLAKGDLTVSEISRLLKRPKSSIFNILKALIHPKHHYRKSSAMEGTR